MIRLFFILFSLLLVTPKSVEACSKFHHGYFSWVPSTKSITVTQIHPEKKSICVPFKDDSQANMILEITQKQKHLLSRKLFIQTNVFWDDLEADGKLKGGTRASQEIFFNTLIPENYQGASLKLYDLKKKKVLGEMSL